MAFSKYRRLWGAAERLAMTISTACRIASPCHPLVSHV
jgi:hypothetical protein